MKVAIKKLEVDMEVKNKGVEFEVYDTDNHFLGDLVVTKSKLVWCRGKTSVDNGVSLKWIDFIDYMRSLESKG